MLQACFVPLGERGIYVKGIFLGINMYTMAGIFCVFLGIINLAAVWKYVREDIRAIEKDSDSEVQNLLEGTAITSYLLLQVIFQLTEQIELVDVEPRMQKADTRPYLRKFWKTTLCHDKTRPHLN